MYNKFRAVSSIQVIAELCVPILGVLGLKAFFSANIKKEEKQKALKKAFFLFGGLIITGFGLAHMFGTFEGLRDAGQYGEIPGFLESLIADRKAMLLADTFRSLILVIISAGFLFYAAKGKLKLFFTTVALTLLLLFDLISVNKKYVNSDDFKLARKIEKPFTASSADKAILEDKTHYRVANFSVDPMNDGSTSYFHNSIGGYHAAKLGRYQELFDFQIAKNNMQVLNMLNTKYFIIADDKGVPDAQQNADANGNAWFVEQLLSVENANQEIQSLDTINTKLSAVIRKEDRVNTETYFQIAQDSMATITLNDYNLTSLVYSTQTTGAQFAVFSEIFYQEGWNAYLDGQAVPHYRVNYVLRGMDIPTGKHTIEFKFEPKVIQYGSLFSLGSYGVLFFVSIGWFFYDQKKKKQIS
jgi:hypothetical protein